MSAAGIIPFQLRVFVPSCEFNIVRTKTRRHEEAVRR
jgi:hypothetical protein